MPCRLSQVVQRNAEYHKKKHKHRVSAAYQAFLQLLLPLHELLHHKRKAVRTQGHQGCWCLALQYLDTETGGQDMRSSRLLVLGASTLRCQAHSQQSVLLIHHAKILLGSQVWVFMATIRQGLEENMFLAQSARELNAKTFGSRQAVHKS